MLHILWLIIKFILMALGAVLGLLLLLLLLVLFCPVRYRTRGEKQPGNWKEATAMAGVSWLFGGISFQVVYHSGKKDFTVRLFGIPLHKRKLRRKAKKAQEQQEQEHAETEPFVKEEPVAAKPEISAETPEAGSSAQAVEPAETENISPGEDAPSEADLNIKKPGLFWRIGDKIKNIRLTFRNIHDKIEQWKKFIHHPRTREAVTLVWKHAKFLFRHILPVRIDGKVTFGCENPAWTGKILAVLGMSFPLHKNRIEVNPLFDSGNYLEGNVKLKGRIYGIVLVRAAIVIYFNKNVKYVIRRVKRMRYKEG